MYSYDTVGIVVCWTEMDCPYACKGSQRHSSRLIAVQLLYQIKQSDISVDDAIVQFKNWIDCDEDEVNSLQTNVKKKRALKKIDIAFINTLIQGVIDYKNDVDGCLSSHVYSDFKRLPIVLLCVLELAVYELLYETIPPQVVINEYIEITKYFFNEKEQSLVNGLLDAVNKCVKHRCS
ncbi:MAG: transcription antitermination factor NusB [Holosporales bacterium]|jgi:N utilization substance protein B|nr:transcription antitermination factor NusB [Holosporales bacterium]